MSAEYQNTLAPEIDSQGAVNWQVPCIRVWTPALLTDDILSHRVICDTTLGR